jgi:hypothetical protein
MAQVAYIVVPTKQDLKCALVRDSVRGDPKRQTGYDGFNARLANYFAKPRPGHLRLVEPIQK